MTVKWYYMIIYNSYTKQKSPIYEAENLLYNSRITKMGGMAMNCMKCGRELKTDGVFCEGCLAEMERYPVNPRNAVYLPNRAEARSHKKVHKRTISPEEQLAALKKKYRRLATVLILTILLGLGLAAVVGVTVYEIEVQRFLGQNYSTVETTG